MKHAKQDTIDKMAGLIREHPEVVEWITAWYTEELRRLPSTVQSVAVAQGRCQALGELVRFLVDAPSLAK